MSDKKKKLHRSRWILFMLMMAFIAEYVISWGLWTGTGREIPMVSAFEWLDFDLGNNFRGFFFILLLFSLFWSCMMSKWKKQAFVVFFLLSFFFIAEDISRLQPWYFIQLFLIGTICFPPSDRGGSRRTMSAVMLILAGTYIWSGLQKMNVAFITETVPWMLENIGIDYFMADEQARLSIDAGDIPPSYFVFLVIPLIEFLSGVGLLFRASRRISAFTIMLMHLAIIITLSPWAGDYNGIVIPWNIAFLLIVYLAMGRLVNEGFLLKPVLSSMRMTFLALVFLVAPALNFIKCYDSNLSARFYTGDREQGAYFFMQTVNPMSGNYASQAATHHYDFEGEYLGSELLFDKWMLKNLHVPFYNEPRYIARMGKKLCARNGFEEGSGILIHYRQRFNSRYSVLTCYCDQLPDNQCSLTFD